MSEPATEFSRIVRCEEIGDAPFTREIVAEAPERDALARRFGIESLDHLSATVTLERRRSGLFRLDGHVSATLTQLCVVSLEPVKQEVDETFSLYYAQPGRDPRESRAGTEVELSLDDEDWPEPAVDGRIDIGEAVAQQVALAIDPYPRAAGAVIENLPDEHRANEPSDNPFRALEGLGKPR